MGRCILVTGGSRSGKSIVAQRLAQSLAGPRAFVATCPAIDDEMRERIRKHQQARRRSDWLTVEEPLDLAAAIERASDHPVVLVDCLTLWVNNLMHEAGLRGREVSESQIARHCKEAIGACRRHSGTIIFVTNEVGMGIVPEDKLTRRFRDLAGRANQTIAAACDEVILAVCGQALTIKPQTQ